MRLRERWIRYSGVQVLRYGVVGASLSLLYVALTTLLAEITPLKPVAASVTAFFLSLPAAYFGHFGLTFRGTRIHVAQVIRFVLAMSNAFIVSTLAMWLAVSIFRVHYAYALVATTAIVATLNYAVLDNWVFSTASMKVGAGSETKSRVSR